MNTSVQDQSVEIIAVEALVSRVQELRQRKARLVQISATRLPDQFELTYSFELGQALTNLRVHLPAAAPRVPSISSVYWCAFLYENEIHDLFQVQVEGIVVDFKGNLYKTTVPYAFGAPPPSSKAPPKPATTAVTAASPGSAASTPASAH